MFDSLKSTWKRKLSRREILRTSSLLALPAIFQGTPVSAQTGAQRTAGRNVYQAIGVRPLINARGTFTIVSGSLMLPEAPAAMGARAPVPAAPPRATDAH